MIQGLIRSTATVGGATLISRVLGFVRDMVIARLFGATAGTDAFFVAFKIPNFMRRLFAEGAFAQSFVPVLGEYKARRNEPEVRDLVAHVMGTLAGVLIGLTAVGMVASPAVITVFAPGFWDEPAKFDLAVSLLRITFPYLPLIALTALAGGILNTYGRFAVPAITPVLLNLSFIGCALWLRPYLPVPVSALAWAVLLAGVVQLAFQLPFLGRLGLLPRPRWGRRHPGVRQVLKLMAPALFGSSVAQINLVVDTLIASFLVTGSVTWLYYSDRLMEFPLGILGIALGTVILPNLSRQYAEASSQEFRSTVDWALRWTAMLGVPAALGLIVIPGPLLASLFQYQAFTGEDVRMASLSLAAYGVGLPGFMLVKVLAPAFYARQDTRTPVRVAVVAMITNIVLNLILVFPLAHAGLALATSIGAWVNGFSLLGMLHRRGVYRPGKGWWGLGLRLALANGAMVALLWLGVAPVSQWLAWGWQDRVAHLLAWVVAAMAVYFVCLRIAGVRLREARVA